MNSDASSVRLIRAIAIAVAVIVVMSVAAEVIKPLALAILLAFILTPLVQWFGNRRLPRAPSVVLVLVLVLVVVALGGLGYVVGGQFASLADQLPAYQANVQKKLATLKPADNSALEKTTRAISNLEKSFRPAEADYATPVRVVSDNATIAQLQSLLGVCPSIAFRRRDSNNPVARSFQSPDTARVCHEQDLSRVVPRPVLSVSAVVSRLAA